MRWAVWLTLLAACRPVPVPTRPPAPVVVEETPRREEPQIEDAPSEEARTRAFFAALAPITLPADDGDDWPELRTSGTKAFAIKAGPRGGALVEITKLAAGRTVLDGVARLLALSADGALAAVARDEAIVIETGTGKRRAVLGNAETAVFAGDTCLWASEGRVFVRDSVSLAASGSAALERSDDGKRVLATFSNGAAREHHVYESGAWTRLTRSEDEVDGATFGADGKIYGVAKKKRIVALDPQKPAVAIVEVDARVDRLWISKDAIYTLEPLAEGSRVRRFPLASKAEPLAQERGKAPAIVQGTRGTAAALLPIPHGNAVTAGVRMQNDLLLRVESRTEPPRWIRYSGADHRIEATSLAKRPLFDANDVDMRRAACGVPLAVLSKRSTRWPAHLLFDATPSAPKMLATDAAWLESGGIVAHANVRSAADVDACARVLVDLGAGLPERLAVMARGAAAAHVVRAIVARPGAFRAAALAEGAYDASPSQRAAYPALLFVSGDESASKMAARLRAVSSSGQPVLISTGSAPSEMLTFLLDRVK
jgi:hypothetical protein